MYTQRDLIVCAGYFVVVLAAGVYAARNQRRTVAGYFRASNQLPWYVIGASTIAAGISSEQFVGEVGYAYKLGMPVLNWEWLVLPAMSLLLWVFVPLYVRNGITTMPEYLGRRFGPKARALFAWLTVVSYVLINFALVFYTGGFALEHMLGVNRLVAVWALALVTGVYTVYGGLTAVAWTGTLQCALLLGGGLYVFVAGMARINWNWEAVLGAGSRAHLITSSDHEVPWTALIILMLSTNVWYYTTNQYIIQRCLAARNEWHAKMGVLFAVALQLLIPLATCFPGMIYRVLNPSLANPDAAYPLVVAEVIPEGLRGLVAAAILSAIMSTIAGLVSSTSTLVTVDIIRPDERPSWTDDRVLRVGRWSGALALLCGAALAPVVMKWENLFRYAQDLWAPMAAPVVVVFLAGALWPRATERGAVACLMLAIGSMPVSFARAILADWNIHLLPGSLDSPFIFAGVLGLVAVVVMVATEKGSQLGTSLAWAVPGIVSVCWLGVANPQAIAVVCLVVGLALGSVLLVRRRNAADGLWDWSMLSSECHSARLANPWLWWSIMAGLLVALYVVFW